MPAYSERLTKISLAVAEIGYLVGYVDFCCLVQQGAVVTLTISGVTGPNVIKIVHNVKKFILFNILKSQLWYCNRFWNGSATKKIGRFFDFNWLPWQCPLTNWKIKYRFIIGMKSTFIWWKKLRKSVQYIRRYLTKYAEPRREHAMLFWLAGSPPKLLYQSSPKFHTI